MIAIANEHIFPIRRVGKMLPSSQDGKQLHVGTVYRWADIGLLRDGRRVKLETLLIGGRVYTSAEAVQRFLQALNDAPSLPASTAAERADAALDALGV